MKSIPSLAIIVLLFFACKLCSFTGTKTPSFPSPSPSPRPLMYAADLIKPQLGSFTLVKRFTKEEMRKTTRASLIKILDQANDAGVGEYRSDTVKSAVLSVYAFSSAATAASTFDEMETEMRQSRRWTLVRAVPRQSGKRIESLGELSGKVRGMVVWNNGHWFFMVIGDDLSEASSLANSVGF